MGNYSFIDEFMKYVDIIFSSFSKYSLLDKHSTCLSLTKWVTLVSYCLLFT